MDVAAPPASCHDPPLRWKARPYFSVNRPRSDLFIAVEQCDFFARVVVVDVPGEPDNLPREPMAETKRANHAEVHGASQNSYCRHFPPAGLVPMVRVTH